MTEREKKEIQAAFDALYVDPDEYQDQIEHLDKLFGDMKLSNSEKEEET